MFSKAEIAHVPSATRNPRTLLIPDRVAFDQLRAFAAIDCAFEARGEVSLLAIRASGLPPAWWDLSYLTSVPFFSMSALRFAKLGHSTIAVTMDIYSHVTQTMQSEAVAKLDLAFGDHFGDQQPKAG